MGPKIPQLTKPCERLRNEQDVCDSNKASGGFTMRSEAGKDFQRKQTLF